MDEFTRNLDDLLYLSAKKYNLVRNLKKNYKENIHYIIKKNVYKSRGNTGGQNKFEFLLTENAFELLKNSFNLRNRYIVEISDNIKISTKFDKISFDIVFLIYGANVFFKYAF